MDLNQYATAMLEMEICINIIKGNMSDDCWRNEIPKGIREIFELTVQLKGTLSGEHGIGLVQKLYGHCF